MLLNSSAAAAFGFDIANAINEVYLNDGANQINDYANTRYVPANDPLDVTEEGPCDFSLNDPNRWQPLSFGGSFVDQAGNETFEDVVPFSGANWGNVTPFALQNSDVSFSIATGASTPSTLTQDHRNSSEKQMEVCTIGKLVLHWSLVGKRSSMWTTLWW